MKKFKTTDEIKIPDKLIDQVIGQERAVQIIKKAAKQHRNVLLIGEPGTGKTIASTKPWLSFFQLPILKTC